MLTLQCLNSAPELIERQGAEWSEEGGKCRRMKLGLVLDWDAEGLSGAELETRKQWEEHRWDVEGPGIPECSINLFLGATTTVRQTEEMGTLFHRTTCMWVIGGPGHPTKRSLCHLGLGCHCPVWLGNLP